MDIIGYILLGSLISFIFLYFLEVVLLTWYANKIKTNNKGVKYLKYQEWNDAWKKVKP